MAKKIPTAEEFIKLSETYDKDYPTVSISDAIEKMIEFTKLHLAEQKRQILKKARIRMIDNSMVIAFGKKIDGKMYSGIIDEHSITNAYHFNE